MPKDETISCINIKFANKKADKPAYIEILKTNENEEICKKILNNRFFKRYSNFEFKKYDENEFDEIKKIKKEKKESNSKIVKFVDMILSRS